MKAFLMILVIVLTGCGATSQKLLSTQANLVLQTKGLRYDLYEKEHKRCLGSSDTLLKYQACMEPAKVVARTADAYTAALKAAQTALTAEGEKGFREKLPCLVLSAKELMDAMRAASVPVPGELIEIAKWFKGYVKGSCLR